MEEAQVWQLLEDVRHADTLFAIADEQHQDALKKVEQAERDLRNAQALEELTRFTRDEYYFRHLTALAKWNDAQDDIQNWVQATGQDPYRWMVKYSHTHYWHEFPQAVNGVVRECRVCHLQQTEDDLKSDLGAAA